MKNLNKQIFSKTIEMWDNHLTCKNFPGNYEDLKQHIVQEYVQQSNKQDRQGVINAVIKVSSKQKTQTKLSLLAKKQARLLKEEENENDSKFKEHKCYLCDDPRHVMKDCWYKRKHGTFRGLAQKI
jgi:hypothetical protein